MKESSDDVPEKADITKSYRMPSCLNAACGFVRLTTYGALEIELYDHSERAQNSFGSDIATIYRVGVSDFPLLIGILESHLGHDVDTSALSSTMSINFENVEVLLEWLTSSLIPFSKTVDFSA